MAFPESRLADERHKLFRARRPEQQAGGLRHPIPVTSSTTSASVIRPLSVWFQAGSAVGRQDALPYLAVTASRPVFA